MPTKRISFTNFNRRLNVAGGREQAGPEGMRRASGVAPETTNSVWSRWGSQLLYNINAIQLYYWNGVRYAYDGANLYANGVSIKSGFNGGKLRFNSMPPQAGLQDYLFILGGGVTPFKISPSGAITNWGIVAPPNQMTGALVAQDQIVISSFVGTAASWTGANLTNKADVTATVDASATPPAVGAGMLRLNPAGIWSITQDFGSAQNWGNYSNGDFVLLSDAFQFWFFFDTFGSSSSSPSTWIEIDIDVHDQSFKLDWYTVAIGLIPSSNATPNVKHNVNYDVTFQTGQWQQVTVPISMFLRNGTNLQLDWTMVQAIRIKGGNFSGNLYLDNMTISGGDGKGAGPAVGNGGSEYDYQVVYRNLTTGSQSNPNDAPLKIFDVQVQQVSLANIPVSSDAQVGARDIYRSQAATDNPGALQLFYLDTIYDNATTTYTDKYADFSQRLTTTHWAKNAIVQPTTAGGTAVTHPSVANYFVDPGNGYYFKLTTPGTTGAQPPQWVVPTSVWGALDNFLLGDTVAPPQATGTFFQCTTAGVSGNTRPNWAAATTLGHTITDGAVVWTSIGTKTTTDNTAVWTYQGINSTLVLGNSAVLLDNAPPQITYGDAYGPFQASMFWTQDSAAGCAGYIYASPPSRPESVGQVYQVSSTNDPMQKLIEFDGRMWSFSQERVYRSVGSYPAIAWQPQIGAHGTTQPNTVARLATLGIVYWAHDGFRIINWSESRLLMFPPIAPIVRGQQEENIPAWSYLNPPTFAARIKDEIVFSDGATLTLALSYDGNADGGLAWRLPGQIMAAMYHDEQTGSTQASWGGNVYLFEAPNMTTDNGGAIPFEMQTAGDMPDIGEQFTTQRVYVSGTFNSQALTPTLIIDGVETTLPAITGNGVRTTIELSPKLCGRLFGGVRLTGNLTNRVEIVRIEADVWVGGQE